MLYDLELPQRAQELPFEAKKGISTYILHESDACCILLLLEDILMLFCALDLLLVPIIF